MRCTKCCSCIYFISCTSAHSFKRSKICLSVHVCIYSCTEPFSLKMRTNDLKFFKNLNFGKYFGKINKSLFYILHIDLLQKFTESKFILYYIFIFDIKYTRCNVPTVNRAIIFTYENRVNKTSK